MATQIQSIKPMNYPSQPVCATSLVRDTQSPSPQRAIPASLYDLNRAQARVTGAVSELMKRLQPVLRVAPAGASPGVPPQPSTNCEIADAIVCEVASLDRAADTINMLLSDLEI